MALVVAACSVLIGSVVSAPAQSLREKLGEQREKLQQAQQREDDVAATIDAYNAEIDSLLGQVAALQSQRDAVEAALAEKQRALDRATAVLAEQRRRLEAARGHLRRALVVLRERLVAIYKSGSPDAIEIILSSSSWSGVVAQSEYLQRVHDYDTAVIARVRTLRNQARAEVKRLRGVRVRIEAARDEIAARERELADTQASLKEQFDELRAAQAARQQLLESLGGRVEQLQGEVSTLSDRIQSQVPEAASGQPAPAAPPVPGSTAELLPDGRAAPPADAPDAVKAVIEAANQISDTPYIWGGGHGSFESAGYDCSGAVSYALHGGGFLDSPLDSTGLSFWGEPGAGSWITVYANAGHTFAVIAGLRWDTSGGAGPRWHPDLRSGAGYVARHPAGY